MRKNILYPLKKRIRPSHAVWLVRQFYKYLLLRCNFPPPVKKIHAGPILGVYIPTYRCNCNCIMCSIQSTHIQETDETPLDESISIIDQLLTIHASGIGFTGGEPFLYPHIYELLRYTVLKKVPVTLSTNGIFRGAQKDEIIQNLTEIPLDNINISIDSVNPSRFDTIRGTHNGLQTVLDFAQDMIHMRTEKQKDTRITAVCVVSRHNIDEIPAITKKTEELGFDAVGFMPLHHIAKDSLTCKDTIIYTKRINTVFNQIENKSFIENSRTYINTFPSAFNGKPFPFPCSAGYTSIYIDYKKNIYACWPDITLNKPLTSLVYNELKDIWKSAIYAEKRREMQACRKCYWNCHAELNIALRPFYQNQKKHHTV